MTTPPEIRAKQGANLGGASAHNRRVVIDALRVNGALSRAQLARATHLTGQTVSNIIADLEQERLVIADAPVRIARGQPARPFRLNGAGAFAIGVQIDRHVTRAVAVDLLGSERVRLDARLPNGGPETGMPVVMQLVKDIRGALQDLNAQADGRIVGLGLAMPGPFGQAAPQDADHWMMSAWQSHPISDDLAAETGLEVAVQNDAAAAATAEKLSGAARGIDDFAYLHFGYGLGAAIFVRGEIHAGSHRNAGEIGMARPGLSGPGLQEPIEHSVSLAALCRELGIDPARPDLFDALDGAVAGGAADAWLQSAGEGLRWVVQILETLLDPETIVFGGAVPPALLEALRARMEPLLPSHAERPDRTIPRLTEGRADPWMVAIGAAAEPIARCFDPRFSAIQNVNRLGGSPSA
ncbi:ROK family transcriptional regulator [Jiella marina]|uniref:ROK family transcriptional regulator n=1 Tax=Jiella sp. LLJ827 TaxID=2917712 RepID=UPI002101585B|nr:ROK family transcriptional regulator [Jiella sp. LLJ827]MCQ0986299.1 ROK family transcriptional regulator [Jiella sp. LLJ827]